MRRKYSYRLPGQSRFQRGFMAKFTVERITATIHKQIIDAKNVVSAIAKAKRKGRDWDLDNQTEEWNAVADDEINPIGFGR